MAEATDTPVNREYPPVSRLEKTKAFIGDLARPFAIIVSSLGASIATVVIAHKIGPDASAAAIFIGAVFSGVAVLYGAKSWENSQTGKHAATVEIAKVTSTTEPPK